jgi:hypothetical protein
MSTLIEQEASIQSLTVASFDGTLQASGIRLSSCVSIRRKLRRKSIQKNEGMKFREFEIISFENFVSRSQKRRIGRDRASLSLISIISLWIIRIIMYIYRIFEIFSKNSLNI